jgi:hypothetical protein
MEEYARMRFTFVWRRARRLPADMEATVNVDLREIAKDERKDRAL